MRTPLTMVLVISLQALSWVVPVRADISAAIPSEFKRSKDITVWVLQADGASECKVEIEKQYLDYSMNPVAMKRFMSLEQPYLRQLGLPFTASPSDQHFVEQESYVARFDGSSEDVHHFVTVLLAGEKQQLVAVRILSIGRTNEQHRLLVEGVQEQLQINRKPR